MPKPTEVPGLSRKSPLAIAAPLLIRSRLADVRRHEPGVRGAGEPDPDAVHDMRVAARRLRAAIALLGAPPLVALEPEVKAVQDALGAVRDLQVQRAWLRARPPGQRREVASLESWADRDRARVERHLARALDAWSGAVVPAIEAAVGQRGHRGRLGGSRVAGQIRDRLRVLDERLRRARVRPSPRRAHRLRIAAKKVRYAAELVRPAFGRAARDALDELVPLQEALGDLHDNDVRIERLGRLSASGAGPERRAAAILLPAVRRERRDQERALGAELERWDREHVVRKLRRAFRSARAR